MRGTSRRGSSIPHYVLDYEERFREKVIEPFARAYIAGETPVPCVACNQYLKFADLFDAANDLGADLLATGHYVVSRDDGRGGRALYRAADADRDQSYFLFATTRAQLARLRFPLGEMPKARVRELARKFGLSNADKADSQDICFVPSGHYTDMIERLLPGASVPGEIVHEDGRVLGRHAGVVNYTIGQRRGIGVAAAQALYVVALDARQGARHRGPALLACDDAASAARCQLDRSRRVHSLAGARAVDRGAGSLHAFACSRSAHAYGRNRVRRARKRRLARSGLRIL